MKIPEKGTLLHISDNGFLYALGELGDAKIGSPFYIRFAGSWPIDDLKRPPLAVGHVAQRFGEKTALVEIDYQFPEAKLEGAQVTWEKRPLSEQVGKGIAPPLLEKAVEKNLTELKLGIGEEWGVQVGDIYGVARGPGSAKTPNEVQLSKRIHSICVVASVTENTSMCKIIRSNSNTLGPLRSNDVAIFFEHTFDGPAPRSSIEILAFDGDDGEIKKRVLSAFESMLKATPNHNTLIQNSSLSADPTQSTFYRVESKFTNISKPKIAVGGRIVEISGVKHLVVNYTGVGGGRGPGMNAAPPEKGIDLGPVATLSEKQLSRFTELVWSSVLIHRGRTSEALIHLRGMLNNLTLKGSMRWHVRDQYAMRWAALGHTREALWLVSQDEEEAGDDTIARLNALGTKVRLLDILGQSEGALAASKTYLEERGKSGQRKNILYYSALAMHIEMLLKADKMDDTPSLINSLSEGCKQVCSDELASLLGAIYWSTPPQGAAMRESLLSKISAATPRDSLSAVASLRMIEGLHAFSLEQYDDATLALLEAEEAYVEMNSTTGVARVNHFLFLSALARKEAQRAFEHALKSITLNRKLDDFSASSKMYEKMVSLYVTFPPPFSRGPYLGAANDVLSAHFQTQIAQGDFAGASKALLLHGTFFMNLGAFEKAQDSLKKSASFAIQSAQFDIAALCHIRLAVIARSQRDRKTFNDELMRASKMAEISEDPVILKIIWNLLHPEESKEAAPLL